jgi:hypothetical protein
MQLDPAFAGELRARDARAVASTGLAGADLALLLAADPVAVSADHQGRRRDQLLDNVASEFALCAARGPRGDGDPAWRQGFLASAFFHRAIAEDESLPLAFAAWLGAISPEAADPAFRALVALEAAMARARRRVRTLAPAVPRGALALAPTSWLVGLPAGSFDFASQLRRALDGERGAELPPGASLDGRSEETVLVAAGEPEGSFALRPLRVESLTPLVARFLRLACAPLDDAALSRFAAEHGIDPAELETVAGEFVKEGVLLRAGGAG